MALLKEGVVLEDHAHGASDLAQCVFGERVISYAHNACCGGEVAV